MGPMDRTVVSRLRDYFLASGGAPASRLLEDENLFQGGWIDSLGIAELMDFIEREFGVSLGPEDITEKNFQSLTAIERLIQSKRS